MIKGSNCSISGKKYELNVYNIVSNCILNGIRFNTQNICELAGCNSKIDIECNYLKDKDIGIEIKKSNAPDWMQCSLKYENNKWIGSLSNKIPDNAKKPPPGHFIYEFTDNKYHKNENQQNVL